MPILDADAILFAQDVFNELDKDGSGKIDQSELQAGAAKLANYLDVSKVPTKTEIKHQLEGMDLDGDGTINFQEFLAFLSMIKVLLICSDMFEAMDTDQSGTISNTELKPLLTEVYAKEGFPPPSDPEVDEIAKKLDKSGDGTIDFQEFSDAVIPMIVALAE